jgi:hypothetical protein
MRNEDASGLNEPLVAVDPNELDFANIPLSKEQALAFTPLNSGDARASQIVKQAIAKLYQNNLVREDGSKKEGIKNLADQLTKISEEMAVIELFINRLEGYKYEDKDLRTHLTAIKDSLGKLDFIGEEKAKFPHIVKYIESLQQKLGDIAKETLPDNECSANGRLGIFLEDSCYQLLDAAMQDEALINGTVLGSLHAGPDRAALTGNKRKISTFGRTRERDLGIMPEEYLPQLQISKTSDTSTTTYDLRHLAKKDRDSLQKILRADMSAKTGGKPRWWYAALLPAVIFDTAIAAVQLGITAVSTASATVGVVVPGFGLPFKILAKKLDEFITKPMSTHLNALAAIDDAIGAKDQPHHLKNIRLGLAKTSSQDKAEKIVKDIGEAGAAFGGWWETNMAGKRQFSTKFKYYFATEASSSRAAIEQLKKPTTSQQSNQEDHKVKMAREMKGQMLASMDKTGDNVRYTGRKPNVTNPLEVVDDVFAGLANLIWPMIGKRPALAFSAFMFSALSAVSSMVPITAAHFLHSKTAASNLAKVQDKIAGGMMGKKGELSAVNRLFATFLQFKLLEVGGELAINIPAMARGEFKFESLEAITEDPEKSIAIATLLIGVGVGTAHLKFSPLYKEALESVKEGAPGANSIELAFIGAKTLLFLRDNFSASHDAPFINNIAKQLLNDPGLQKALLDPAVDINTFIAEAVLDIKGLDINGENKPKIITCLQAAKEALNKVKTKAAGGVSALVESFKADFKDIPNNGTNNTNRELIFTTAADQELTKQEKVAKLCNALTPNSPERAEKILAAAQEIIATEMSTCYAEFESFKSVPKEERETLTDPLKRLTYDLEIIDYASTRKLDKAHHNTFYDNLTNSIKKYSALENADQNVIKAANAAADSYHNKFCRPGGKFTIFALANPFILLAVSPVFPPALPAAAAVSVYYLGKYGYNRLKGNTAECKTIIGTLMSGPKTLFGIVNSMVPSLNDLITITMDFTIRLALAPIELAIEAISSAVEALNPKAGARFGSFATRVISGIAQAPIAIASGIIAVASAAISKSASAFSKAPIIGAIFSPIARTFKAVQDGAWKNIVNYSNQVFKPKSAPDLKRKGFWSRFKVRASKLFTLSNPVTNIVGALTGSLNQQAAEVADKSSASNLGENLAAAQKAVATAAAAEAAAGATAEEGATAEAAAGATAEAAAEAEAAAAAAAEAEAAASAPVVVAQKEQHQATAGAGAEAPPRAQPPIVGVVGLTRGGGGCCGAAAQPLPAGEEQVALGESAAANEKRHG